MAIFPHIEVESVLQANDRTRIDGSKSFITPDNAPITAIEIDPDGTGFIDVTSAGFLDWEYATSGVKTPVVRLTAGAQATDSSSITVLSELDDKLFSDDQRLKSHEPDILKWVQVGRNSYKDLHRRVQELVLDSLDSDRIWDTSGNRLTKAAIVDIEEVRQWATFMALKLIFRGMSNAVDDVFFKKGTDYSVLAGASKNRATLRLDITGDGTISSGEKVDILSKNLVRT